MYFFIPAVGGWGGGGRAERGFQKITVIRGQGHVKTKVEIEGSYNFEITLLQIPPATAP